MNSLPAQIFADVGQAQDRLVGRAWGAALTLVLMILVLTLFARLVARKEPTRMRPQATEPVTSVDQEKQEQDRRARRTSTARRSPASRRPQRTKVLATGRRVSVRDLNAYYGGQHAVKGLDIEFAPNEVTAIIGPSGCGKSTMVRCINRMHEEVPGRARDGQGDARRRRHLRRRRGRRVGAADGRHGVPEAEPVPDDVDVRQRRRRHAADRRARRQPARARGADAARRRPVGRGQGPPRQAGHRACPAASSSGSASRARSRSSPR